MLHVDNLNTDFDYIRGYVKTLSKHVKFMTNASTQIK